jgi:hypothetical protein
MKHALKIHNNVQIGSTCTKTCTTCTFTYNNTGILSCTCMHIRIRTIIHKHTCTGACTVQKKILRE